MDVRVRGVDLFATPCRTRIPFRFGITTLTEALLVTARLRAELDGLEAEGYASDLLVPKWFEKDPRKSARQDGIALGRSARRAARAFADPALPPMPLFPLWLLAHRRCVGGPDASGVALVDGFGVALVERALIDASCRARNESFFDALRADRFAVALGAVHPELEGLRLGGLLPEAPAAQIILRHTVGLADPLAESDVPDELRGEDGHPVSLEADIRSYGLRSFKLKVGGDTDADLARLRAIGRIVAAEAGPDVQFTVDGNEQYGDAAALARLLDRVASDADARIVTDNLLYIEQPLPRQGSFDDPDGVRALARIAPVILDEADAGFDAFPRALACGYGGVSVKNCKGVLRALINRGLCIARGGEAFQASEDLTNLPLLPLQQDLATAAALDLPHSERNGHHYFAGLSHLPGVERDAALAAHPDLYVSDARGARLRIEAGALQLGSLQVPGYGTACAVDLAARTPLEELLPELRT
jgi:hypothetical protein